jgi:zinc transport system substrate-binding protein
MSFIAPTPLGVAIIALVSTLGLSACSTPSDTPTTTASKSNLRVSANFYPVEWLAREIGGDRAEVAGLTPTGEEPHDLALTAKSREALENSDLIFYLGSGFQPDIEKAVGNLTGKQHAVDLLTSPGITLLDAPKNLGKESLAGNKDPHVWLDPTQMIAMANEIADKMSKYDPAGSQQFITNRDVITAALSSLDRELSAKLADCTTKTIVTSHAAFEYLSKRYGLTQLPVRGVSPDSQPNPATLQSIANAAKKAGVTTVFFEDVLPKDISETIAREIGAKLSLLSALEFDPAETISPSEDYLSVMRGNGNRLALGLGCGT